MLATAGDMISKMLLLPAASLLVDGAFALVLFVTLLVSVNSCASNESLCSGVGYKLYLKLNVT